MKTFIWLVRRELWENKSFWLVPVVLTVLLVLAYIAGIVFTWVHGIHVVINGHPASSLATLAAAHPEDARQGLFIFYVVLTSLFNVVLIFMMVRYLLGCLYDDRRDRSILFWRSLPVSDVATALSKLAVVMVVAPLATFSCLLLAQLIGTGALSAIATQSGVSATAVVWGQSHLGGIWAFLIVGFLVQSLWYLPFYGWCMMASAWARRAPFLWAAVPILVGGIVEGILFQSNHFFTMVGLHAASVVPGIGANIKIGAADYVHLGNIGFSMHSLATMLDSASMWIGVGFGIVFVAAAIAIRRWRAEDY
ncbi:MAG TPA: hypothetical protein VFK96_06395 [Gammaproteobacteria bacterium]|nr:hypothetical protein [Gammaproteobacteria bacterium]